MSERLRVLYTETSFLDELNTVFTASKLLSAKRFNCLQPLWEVCLARCVKVLTCKIMVDLRQQRNILNTKAHFRPENISVEAHTPIKTNTVEVG